MATTADKTNSDIEEMLKNISTDIDSAKLKTLIEYVNKLSRSDMMHEIEANMSKCDMPKHINSAIITAIFKESEFDIMAETENPPQVFVYPNKMSTNLLKYITIISKIYTEKTKITLDLSAST